MTTLWVSLCVFIAVLFIGAEHVTSPRLAPLFSEYFSTLAVCAKSFLVPGVRPWPQLLQLSASWSPALGERSLDARLIGEHPIVNHFILPAPLE